MNRKGHFHLEVYQVIVFGILAVLCILLFWPSLMLHALFPGEHEIIGYILSIVWIVIMGSVLMKKFYN